MWCYFLVGCDGFMGLVFIVYGMRLMLVCVNNMVIVSDLVMGKVIDMIVIGKVFDGVLYDVW